MHDDPEKPWYGDWAKKKRPLFDLFVVYYGHNPEKAEKYRNHSKFFLQEAGPKWSLVRRALNEKVWMSYEYIWLPDDDLKISAGDIGMMFIIASKYKLKLGQPALYDQNVVGNYREILVVRPGLTLHFTNFVEIMCPFFNINSLKMLKHTIDDKRVLSGWGLDLVWPRLLGFQGIGVIDKTPVLHTRPQNAFRSGATETFYSRYHIDPQEELRGMLKRFNTSWYAKAVYKEVPDISRPSP